MDISYTITNLLSIIVPGIIAGFFAGKFMEGRSFSVLVNLFIGIAGAFLGATLLFFLTSFVRKT